MKSRTLRERYGRWALVAGGSEGIGAAFASALAAQGLDLVLVAEKPEPLEAFGRSLAQQHGREVRTIVADLAELDAVEALLAQVRALEISVLVCNAAIVPFGAFLDISREEKLRAVAVNCRAPLLLVDALAPLMVERGRGAVVLMSSLAGRQGSALFSTYAASKAFDLVLAESLWEELRVHHVDVLGVCAGATRTPGWNRSGIQPLLLAPPVMEPEEVVREALAALGHTPSLVVGRWNRLAALFLERVLPRRVAISALAASTRSLFRNRQPREG